MAPRRYRVWRVAITRLLMPLATPPQLQDSRSLRSLVPFVVGLRKASQGARLFLQMFFMAPRRYRVWRVAITRLLMPLATPRIIATRLHFVQAP